MDKVRGPEPRMPQTLDEELIGAQEAAVVSTLTDHDRLERIEDELRAGFETLAPVGAAASFFGSARTPEDHPEYLLARRTAKLVGESGMAVITGGGPGAMEAANRGRATPARSRSGSTSSCRSSRAPTPTATSSSSSTISSPARSCSCATRAASWSSPAASGRSTSCSRRSRSCRPTRSATFPIVLVGTAYWQGLVDWIRERLLTDRKISPGDLDLFRMTDDPLEVRDALISAVHRRARA